MRRLALFEHRLGNWIDYISSDSKGNKYQLTAELAEIKKEDPSLMFLENVIAYIYSKNSDTIKITSNFGKYNTSNYETIFLDNVIITLKSEKREVFSFLNINKNCK